MNSKESKSQTLWRAFAGEPGHRDNLDERAVTWEQARDALIAFLLECEVGGCDQCDWDRARGLTELGELPAETVWTGSYDWDDLYLTPDDQPIGYTVVNAANPQFGRAWTGTDIAGPAINYHNGYYTNQPA